MISWLRKQWQISLRMLTGPDGNLQKRWRIFLGVIIGIVFITIIGWVIYLKCVRYWIWTTWANQNSIGGKTIWEWLDLLIVPIVLVLGAFWLQRSERIREQKNVKDQQRDAVLQAYIVWIRELVQDDDTHLQKVNTDDDIRAIARTKTLTTLATLDSFRKRQLLECLFDTKLSTREDSPIVLIGLDLQGVDLHKAYLRGVILPRVDFSGAKLQEINLSGAEMRVAKLHWADLRNAILNETKLFEASFQNANLCGAKLLAANLTSSVLDSANMRRADLSDAILHHANLSWTDLTGANLSKANLSWANLSNANLSNADLSGAIVTDQQLAKVKSLAGAKMPNGEIFDPAIHFIIKKGRKKRLLIKGGS